MDDEGGDRTGSAARVLDLGDFTITLVVSNPVAGFDYWAK